MDQKKYAGRLELKAGAEGVILARFATLNVKDSDGDVTLPGAFGSQEVTVQPVGHQTRELMVGKGRIFEEGEQAILEAQMLLTTQAGKDHFETLKFDIQNGTPLQEWSYTFDIEDAEPGEHGGEKVQFLKKLKVHSVDPVFRGAGVATATLGAKAKGMTFDAHMAAADSLLDDLSVFAERARALGALRSEEGKELSEEKLEHLRAQEYRLAVLLKGYEPLTVASIDADALAEFLRDQKRRFERQRTGGLS